MSSQSGETNRELRVPRAVIHKKILDAAQSCPNASIEELATTVNGASEELIERVFNEYGDPAEGDPTATEVEHEVNQTQSNMASMKTDGTMSDEGAEQAHEIEQESVEVTKKQREALHAIREYPDATQNDLAERFDVTQSTINGRLNSIEGFEWEHRQKFAENMIKNNKSSQDDTTSSDTSVQDNDIPSSVPMQDLLSQVDSLTEQVETVNQRLDDQSPSDQSPFGDPELASKIVHSCINSDNITEEEELQILKELIE